MNRTSDTVLRKPAHPMTGWLAVIPVPDPDGDVEGRAPDAAVVEIGGHRVTLIDLVIGTAKPQAGMQAGLVMEIGPLPDGSMEEQEAVQQVVPYAEGCTVYYASDRGVRIGEFLYLRIDSVMAWEEAPHG